MNSEFSDIITSYQHLTNMDSHSITNLLCNDVLFTKCNTQRVQELEQNLSVTVSKEHEVSTDAMKLRPAAIKEEVRIPDLHEVIDLQDTHQKVSNKYKYSAVSIQQSAQKNYNFLEYREKINIPKQGRKRGYTYKLNDCYYDETGLFLYRVPGMDT